jgi:hypothetical protein
MAGKGTDFGWKVGKLEGWKVIFSCLLRIFNDLHPARVLLKQLFNNLAH